MKDKPGFWIPTLYLAEGMPYTAVIFLSVVFFKLQGLDNTEIGLYTGWLYLPWLIKPIWSPLVEKWRSSKFWIVLCQLILGATFASVGLTIPLDNWLRYCIIFLWLAAFASATHDIAVDGFYINALDKQQQAFWVGIRSTFYKIAMLFCQGLLVILAGYLEKRFNVEFAWQVVFIILGMLMILFGIYHLFILPKDVKNGEAASDKSFKKQIVSYFQKDHILLILGFLLLYRLGEAQLSKMSPVFLLDKLEDGGLGLSAEELGTINGTFGLIAMSLGGILGGIAISRKGLKYWLVPMILFLNVPDILYAIMATVQTQSTVAIASMISVEQFGYGFGFAAYSMFMLLISKGEYSTSHFSISTAFMAAGMMVPGMFSGYLQNLFGYPAFFIWVVLCAVPSLVMAVYVKRTKYLNDDN